MYRVAWTMKDGTKGQKEFSRGELEEANATFRSLIENGKAKVVQLARRTDKGQRWKQFGWFVEGESVADITE